MIDMEKIMESMAKHRHALAEAWKVNREAFFATLSAVEITSVTVTFDGEGDSGQITDIAAYKGEESVALPALTVALRTVDWSGDEVTVKEQPLSEAIETVCYAFLEQEHGGWENNDGAYGEFTFDIAGRTVELEFNGRYTDIHVNTHSF